MPHWKVFLMKLARSLRLPGLACAILLAASCARQDLDEPPVDLGPFRLGLNIVVADNMEKVPISRDATVEEWEDGLKKAVQDRFGRYEGDRYYNIGINVDGYALAPPGIPIVAAPKSVVVVTANIWDDGTQTRLNPEPKQFYVFENLSGESVIGTGLTSNKRQQLAALSYNTAKALEGWFLENPQWFDPAGAIPGAAPDLSTPPPTPRVVSATPGLSPGAVAVEATVLPDPGAVAVPVSPAVRPPPRPAEAAPAN
jgi:hypothetical protein